MQWTMPLLCIVYFNPLAPRGARRRYIGARELFEAFQSTSSSRSQTKMKTFGLLLIKISIH